MVQLKFNFNSTKVISAIPGNTTHKHNLIHVLMPVINDSTNLKSAEKNLIRIILVQTLHFLYS